MHGRELESYVRGLMYNSQSISLYTIFFNKMYGKPVFITNILYHLLKSLLIDT